MNKVKESHSAVQLKESLNNKYMSPQPFTPEKAQNNNEDADFNSAE